MYNPVTEEKIRQIPGIGDINIDRLPQELTRIYAQIVSLRRQFIEGLITFQSEELTTSLRTCQTLASNLETILITTPNHPQKESIAFVAATTHSLIQKMGVSSDYGAVADLQIDTISPLISGIVLFLVGNSQADAAELAHQLIPSDGHSAIQNKLIDYLRSLATGQLSNILDNPITEGDVNWENLQGAAIDYLWKCIGTGIYAMATSLTTFSLVPLTGAFDQVVDLSVSESVILGQGSVFAGPHHLAKLLKLLEGDILARAVIKIETPAGVDPTPWNLFLSKLAKERPYLWENHKDATDTDFLDPGISSVLTLPTGAGKSTLSELKIASCLYSGRSVIFLVPTHALEDQVNRNLKKLFSEFSPQLMAYDEEYTAFDDITSFPILVMTPERCLTQVNMNPEILSNVGLIVFDEFHLISGKNIHKDRRSIDAMYCLVALFTQLPKADYMLISAMVENGAEIVEWIESVTERDCILFNSSWKPTRQLHGCLIFEDNKITKLNDLIKQSRKEKRKAINPPVALQRSLTITPHCFFSLKNVWDSNSNKDYYKVRILPENILLAINNSWKLTTNRNDVAARLAIHFSGLGLKTLVFVDDPRIAKSTAQKIETGLLSRLSGYDAFIVEKANEIESLAMELGDLKHSFIDTQKNVGVHHGLLLPMERGLIEEYFKRANGSITLVATATLAQGINLPAEIVIIAGDDRFDDATGFRERVQPHELLNAAGRAGRAGQSSQGAVILIPGEIVTVKNAVVSDKWWQLKKEVFSKSDQCVKIEDPLEHFLDSIQDDSEELDLAQTKVLYRFKAENLSETETRKLFKNSFYAHKAAKQNQQEAFDNQVSGLIRRRNELDALSEDVVWTKEISFKTGFDPMLILELGKAIEEEHFDEFINFSVIEYMNWFLGWIESDVNFLGGVFTKQSAIVQIKKAVGIKVDNDDPQDIIDQFPTLGKLLTMFLEGATLLDIDNVIPGRADINLTKARNFAIRLIPEISNCFGLLSAVVVEMADQQGISKTDLPWNIKALASCIREGFDDAGKLFYKKNHRILGRVETHVSFLI